MKKVFLSTLILSGLLLSCKDDDQPAAGRAQLLTSTGWYLTGGILEGEEQDVDFCYDDDELVFQPDGDFRWDYGNVKCVDGDPDVVSGMWTLTKDDTELTIDSGAGPLKFRILELTASTLTVERKDFPLIYFFEPVQ